MIAAAASVAERFIPVNTAPIGTAIVPATPAVVAAMLTVSEYFVIYSHSKPILTAKLPVLVTLIVTVVAF
jgi:hypothetical protein